MSRGISKTGSCLQEVNSLVAGTTKISCYLCFNGTSCILMKHIDSIGTEMRK